MDIQVVHDNGEIVEADAPKEPKAPDTEVHADGVLMTQQIAEMFDLKPSEISRYQRKLQTLIDYAKTKTDDHSAPGLKWAIRSLSLKVGTPPLGEKLINYLSKYAYLATERGKLDKEIERYEYGPNN